MKKNIKTILSFVSGALAMLFVISLVNPAWADTATKNFNATVNSLNVNVEGKQVLTAGEDYTLSNGAIVSSSLNVDGTTYIPLRRIGEALDLNVSYDSKSNTANLNKKGSSDSGNTTTTSPTPTTSPTATSTINQQDYNNFKAMWNMKIIQTNMIDTLGNAWNIYGATYSGNLSADNCKTEYFSERDPYKSYINQMMQELKTSNTKIKLFFYYKDNSELYMTGLN